MEQNEKMDKYQNIARKGKLWEQESSDHIHQFCSANDPEQACKGHSVILDSRTKLEEFSQKLLKSAKSEEAR